MNSPTPAEDRTLWVATAHAIAYRALQLLGADNNVREPFEEGAGMQTGRSTICGPLEMLGRTLAGLSPWLALARRNIPEQEALFRAQLVDAAIVALEHPSHFEIGRRFRQPLVDLAYLAYALTIARPAIWEPLSNAAKGRILNALQAARTIRPYDNNWHLFRAMIECTIGSLGGEQQLDSLFRSYSKVLSWYVGDGHYSDGPSFQMNFYNSLVIHPFLLFIAEATPALQWLRPRLTDRARRYASILEKMISPDGYLPVVGRSITYRFGVLFHLSFMAWKELLLDSECPRRSLSPAAIRCAMTAVLRHFRDDASLFRGDGLLQLGYSGKQPRLAEPYINTGSLYACMLFFPALGLAPISDFWTLPFRAWTAVEAWSSSDIHFDYAIL